MYFHVLLHQTLISHKPTTGLHSSHFPHKSNGSGICTIIIYSLNIISTVLICSMTSVLPTSTRVHSMFVKITVQLVKSESRMMAEKAF